MQMSLSGGVVRKTTRTRNSLARLNPGEEHLARRERLKMAAAAGQAGRLSLVWHIPTLGSGLGGGGHMALQFFQHAIDSQTPGVLTYPCAALVLAEPA